MLVSMTGFGRSSVPLSLGQLIVEIQTVNRRYLEVFVSLPKEFSFVENEVRKWVGEAISRGQVNVRMHIVAGPEASIALLPDVKTLRALKTSWETIASSLGYDPKAVDLPFLVQNLPEWQPLSSAQEGDLPLLRRGFDAALQALLQMRKKEGQALGQDLEARILAMEAMVSSLEQGASKWASKMRQKLQDKMEEVLPPSVELDERLLREVALFAEKVDITEEITRAKSHFVQFKEWLQAKEGAVGKKMDFLVQEIGREVNTMGAKAADAEGSRLIVELKSELEKIREQIQNIE